MVCSIAGCGEFANVILARWRPRDGHNAVLPLSRALRKPTPTRLSPLSPAGSVNAVRRMKRSHNPGLGKTGTLVIQVAISNSGNMKHCSIHCLQSNDWSSTAVLSLLELCVGESFWKLKPRPTILRWVFRRNNSVALYSSYCQYANDNNGNVVVAVEQVHERLKSFSYLPRDNFVKRVVWLTHPQKNWCLRVHIACDYCAK